MMVLRFSASSAVKVLLARSTVDIGDGNVQGDHGHSL